MTSINFAGNLAADPELRFTPSGRAVTRFTVIENRRRRTEDGQGWEDAEPNVYRVGAGVGIVRGERRRVLWQG